MGMKIYASCWVLIYPLSYASTEFCELQVDHSRNDEMSMLKTRRMVQTFVLMSTYLEQIYVSGLELSIDVLVYVIGLLLHLILEMSVQSVQIRSTVKSKIDAV